MTMMAKWVFVLSFGLTVLALVVGVITILAVSAWQQSRRPSPQ